MAKNFSLRLTSKLDTKSIKTDLETLNKSLKKKPLKISLEISKADKSYLNTIKEIMKSNKTLQMSFKEVSNAQKGFGNTTKQTIETMSQYNRQVTQTQTKTRMLIENMAGIAPNNVIKNLKDLEVQMERLFNTGDMNRLKEYKSVLNTATSEFKASQGFINNKDEAKLKSMINSLNTFSVAKNKAFKRNPELANELERVQSKAMDALLTIQSGGKNSKASIDSLSKEFKQLSANINTAQQKTMTFKEQLMEAGKKFGMWSGVTTLYFKAIQGMQAMITNVIELDTSLTELRKVTDLTDEQIIAFTQSAYEAGTTLGRTGKEVIDATQIFSQAGYDIHKAFDLSQVALTLLNVGDGIEDVDVASQTLISTMKGFRMQTGEAMSVVDKLNKVKYYCLSIQMINV